MGLKVNESLMNRDHHNVVVVAVLPRKSRMTCDGSHDSRQGSGEGAESVTEAFPSFSFNSVSNEKRGEREKEIH